MNAFRLAWRHLWFHWRRTAILVGCLVISSLVPLVLSRTMPEVQRQLQSRAVSTPVVFGGAGSRLELALHALYFRELTSETIRYATWRQLQQEGFDRAVPLHVRFQADGFPIVGTHLEYLQFRGLKCERGEVFGRLGDCVLGNAVARELKLDVGQHVISSPRSILSLAADYPLKMTIVGVLQPTGTPDDHAIFVDIKTAWIIENLGHGHDDISKSNDPNLVLERNQAGTVASAAVTPYTEVTEENLASFHFHGDVGDFPVTAIVMLSPDQRSQDLAAGLLEQIGGVQTVFARDSIDELLAILFQVQNLVVAASLFVGFATLLLFGLVFSLAMHIRKPEIETMQKLGASRGLTFSLLTGEILVISAVSGILALVLSSGVAWGVSSQLSRWLA